MSLGRVLGGPTVPTSPDRLLLVAGGPDELAEKFSITSIMYGLCRIQDPSTGAHRIVLINWVSSRAWGGGVSVLRTSYPSARDPGGQGHGTRSQPKQCMLVPGRGEGTGVPT